MDMASVVRIPIAEGLWFHAATVDDTLPVIWSGLGMTQSRTFIFAFNPLHRSYCLHSRG